MRLSALPYLILLLLSGFVACMPDEEVLQHEAVNLRFSTDTVFFDTLFTSEQSITRRLRVYNTSNKAVLLDNIMLAEGDASPYTLYVNGKPGKSFGTQQLLGGDSLLLLLEVRLPATAASKPYLAADAVVIVNKGVRQEVPVVGWGQNVHRLGKSIVDCNTVWTNTRPYLVEDTLLVKSGCTLTIEKGTRIYFKPVAALVIAGTLIAEGDSANHVVFRNSRLDPLYEHQPGQWKGILFVEGSHSNRLRFTDIRNAMIGIRLGTPDNNDEPDLVLENCRLENHLQAGILCYTSDLEATNTLIANSAGPAVANLAGGNYRYIHCTFVNYFRGQREVPAAVFSDNTLLANNQLLVADLNLTIKNSIIWGNLPSGNELLIDRSGNAQVMVQLENNLIRSSNSQFAEGGNILSTNLAFVKFQNVGTYNFRPDTLSPAIGAALPLGVERDLSGKKRDSKPDIGALEYFYVPKKK